MKKLKVYCMYVCMSVSTHLSVYEDSIMELTKHSLKKRRRGEDGNIMERVSSIKMHCMHGWNYHNETLSHY
jgi:hypothetical protein